MNTAIINSDTYEKHDTGDGHPEQPKRVIAIKEKLKKRNDLIWETPVSVPEDILAMTHSKEYIELDRLSARNFVKIAKMKISHVIYLGGISPKEKNISEHLSSRIEVGKILSKSLPTTELRAGPIIGSGSASFEMLRHLSEKLPIMAVSYTHLRAHET